MAAKEKTSVVWQAQTPALMQEVRAALEGHLRAAIAAQADFTAARGSLKRDVAQADAWTLDHYPDLGSSLDTARDVAENADDWTEDLTHALSCAIRAEKELAAAPDEDI